MAMTILSKEGITERDPARWEILSIEKEDTEEAIVTFAAGGVIFECARNGRIYHLWEKEMERRRNGLEGNGVVELEEGKVITIEQRMVEIPQSAPELKHHPPPVIDLQAQEKALEERKDLAGAQWRMESLRSQLRTLPYCRHDEDICTNECKLREELIALEKKCLKDP